METQCPYHELDAPVRHAVKLLHIKGIPTNSSEGGGHNHGAPAYIYIEAKLSPQNYSLCRHQGLLLDQIPGRTGLLFGGSGLAYGEKTGYYPIGFNRHELSTFKATARIVAFIEKLEIQRT